jgi:hypothetical protein
MEKRWPEALMSGPNYIRGLRRLGYSRPFAAWRWESAGRIICIRVRISPQAGLKKGEQVTAVIKVTAVMVQKGWHESPG